MPAEKPVKYGDPPTPVLSCERGEAPFVDKSCVLPLALPSPPKNFFRACSLSRQLPCDTRKPPDDRRNTFVALRSESVLISDRP